MSPQNKPSGAYRWGAFAIVVAVFGWGVYLAWGAALNESQDLRKSAIIMACTVVFLLFWLVFLFQPKSDLQIGVWNVASLYSFFSSLLTLGLVALVYFGMSHFSDVAQGRTLLAALVLAGSSSVAVVVGLSRPTPLRGQRFAFVAVLLLLLAAVLGVATLRKSAAKATQFAAIEAATLSVLELPPQFHASPTHVRFVFNPTVH